MELIDLENIANREKIPIINYKMKKTKARIVNYVGSYIFMDYHNIKTYTEEKCLLAEELGHYYMDATYPASTTDKVLINKQEYRARKWSYYVLIPFENLKSAILNRNQ